MIIKIQDFIFTSNAIFSVIVISFVVVVILLTIENRKDNQKIKRLNQTIQELIAGDYKRLETNSQNPVITELIGSVNQLSEVIRVSQEDLEQETRRLSNILSYMTDGVLATNRKGEITLINQMACQLLGVSEEEALGQPILHLLALEDEYDLRQLIIETPITTIDSQDGNGDYHRLRAQFTLVKRDSGFVAGLVAVLHDTTEQEKEERERRLFVSNVSHELRTPLTSVKSYLEALEDGALTEPVAPDFIHVSLTETNRMMRMITDLLSLSRIDNEASKLEVEMINFTAFMTHILNRFDKIRSQGGDKEYELVRQYPFSPIWIEIDTDKMTQVLDNILNNAIKYSPDGGTITVSLQTTDSQLIIVISDQGLGIPQKDLPKIFDRFYRVDKARSRSQGGTGLGLAIAKEIVKQHQGFIWAKSDYGKGSTFTIVLPYEKNLSDEGEWDEQTGVEESDG